jgi:hypothetical protein
VRDEGWVEVPPPIGEGGSFARIGVYLLAISALISVSAYFRLLPPLLSICSSIASATVLLCAALVLAAMCTALLDLLCLPISLVIRHSDLVRLVVSFC